MNPETIESLLLADPDTHIYGLADLDEPFWSHSTWYGLDGAVVGFISTGGDWIAGYAMSQVDPERTLDLLGRVQRALPAGTWITGPIGLHDSVSTVRSARPIGRHWRMILDETEWGTVDGVVDLGPAEADALADLYESDPGAAFFLPSMLEYGHFVGIEDEGVIVAAAGTHVTSAKYGVAALGAILTRPSHRGRGLGRLATAALCGRLVDNYQTIGLNVASANRAAISMYVGLGFTKRFEYEEIELI